MPKAGSLIRASDIGGGTGCRLRRAAPQAVPTGVFTSVTWDTEDADTDGFITVSGTTVTIPTGLDGLYGITANAVGTTLTGSGHLAFVFTSALTGFPADILVSLDVAIADRGGLGVVVPLLAGDTFVTQVRHTTGSDQNWTAWLSCYRIAAFT